VNAHSGDRASMCVFHLRH